MKIIFSGLLIISSLLAHAQTKTYDTLPNVPEHYVKRYALFKKDPIKEGRIIMVGNSITEGADWKTILKDSTVINRGISGDVTFGVLHRLKEITDRKPSKLFLLIGINDLSRNTSEEVIIENIFSIVSNVRSASPKTSIFVQTILPTNDSVKNMPKKFLGKSEQIKTINTQLKKYEKKLHYTCIDLYNSFLDAEGRLDVQFTGDGLHLNAKGYSRWVAILKKEKYL